MGVDTIEDVLTHLGIKSTLNREGKLVRTIDVINSAHPDGQPLTAYFDEKLSKWKFDKHNPREEFPNQHQPRDVRDPSRDEASIAEVAVTHVPPTSRLDNKQWTDALPASPHTDFFRSRDWAATPIGACHTWPYALRLYAHMLFVDSRAAAIFWGKEKTAMYNEHMLPLIGSLHPLLMSQELKSVVPAMVEILEPTMHAVEKSQMGLTISKIELPMERHGYVEESWWDGSFSPLKDDQGQFGGTFSSWVEVTRTVLRDRATALLHKLGPSPRFDTNSSNVWQHIHTAFTEHPRDITMAIIYGAENAGSDQNTMHLKHTIGLNTAHTVAPATINLASLHDRSVLSPLFRRARRSTTDFIILDVSKGDVDSAVTENIEWGGYGEPSKHLVVISLACRETIKGYILLGLNPRRGLDPDHEQFVLDLVHQLRDLMTRVTSEEEAQSRERLLTDALSETENRIRRVVELAPAGIYELLPTGTLLWANSHFFDILGVAPYYDDLSTLNWREYILPEDLPQTDAEFAKGLNEKVSVSGNVRLIRHWRPPGSPHSPQLADEPYWILYSATPELNEDGSVRCLTGCITNVSQLKWAEQLQIRTAEAAVRDKKQQEEFIDITSHELRNPLSAITQCADGIIASLDEVKDSTSVQSLGKTIRDNVEAAESIAFCAAHQRRIIDDVLALGKLDSGLLAITPKAFRPQSLIDEAIQMLRGEFATNQIEVITRIDGESVLTSTSFAQADSARIMQILVNLLTNAIKFTRTQTTRTITIRFGSSYCLPETDLFGRNFRWHSTGKSWPDLTQEASYGHGTPVYMYYSVTDTGTGIAGESSDKVFRKFEQADRRTYVNYGGSGLGLFISNKLAEIQGGKIGVESKEAVGSTFAFYTKAKCAQNQASTHYSTTSSGKNNAKVTDDSHTSKRNNKMAHNDDMSQPVSGTTQQHAILLVEDNLVNQRVLAKQLKKAGCAVYLANHGGEAIDIVLHVAGRPAEYSTRLVQDALPKQIDCILMDWEMPVCNGLAATKRIREVEAQQEGREKKKKNNIIGITANARSEQITKAIEAGMDDVVSKPFRVTDLLLKIDDLVKRSERSGN